MNVYVQIRTACACAVAIAVVPGPTRAQVTPKFDRDNFEDRNIQDEMPFNWDGYAVTGTTTLDASSGDLVVTSPSGFATIAGHSYGNVSMRTQVAIPEESEWISTGFVARANLAEATGYDAVINSRYYTAAPSTLLIGAYSPDVPNGFEFLAQAPTDLDPSETDVMMQFDLVGDTLTLTAWAAGTPKESAQQISTKDSRFQHGEIGLEFWDSFGAVGPSTRTPGTFRFFEAVPEPSACMLAALGFLSLLAFRRMNLG